MLIEKFVAILLISKYLNIRLSQARFCISKDTGNILTNKFSPIRSICSQRTIKLFPIERISMIVFFQEIIRDNKENCTYVIR